MASAQLVADYVEDFRSANLDVEKAEFHDATLTELVRQIRLKLLRPKNLVRLKKPAIPGVDFTTFKQTAQGVLSAVHVSWLDPN